MQRLGQFLSNRRNAAVVVALTLLFAAVCGLLATRVETDHDVLAFLPADNPEIQAFREINARFGGLEVALVGIETEDVFEPGFLEQLRRTTRAVRELPQIDHALSLANVDDFSPDPEGGIRTAPLIETLPSDASSRAALRARVLSRDTVVGTLVDTTGSAVVLYAFATPDTDPSEAAEAIQDAVQRGLPDATLYWGGSPFVATYIHDATQADMARLTPWAILAILVIMLVSFRDPIGAGTGLIATGCGILGARAAMAILGVPLNVVLGAMPILLFAIGSAYGIHLLARYQVHASVSSPEEAVQKTLLQTGPTVLVAGLTTMAGLSSVALMDIAPLRSFGLFTALGIGIALFVSLTFVPAVAVLARLPGRASPPDQPPSWWVQRVMDIHLYRPTFAIVLGLLVLAGAGFTGRIDTRMDQAAFYSEDNPPALADAFLAEHFGGSMFVQLQVQADLTNSHVLREVQRVADELAGLEHVSGVQHGGQVVALLNQAMEGARRIPDESAKVQGLYGLLTGHPALRQLITEDRTHGMVVVRLSSSALDDVEETLEAIEDLVSRSPARLSVLEAHHGTAAQRRQALVRARLLALAPSATSEGLDQALESTPPPPSPESVTRTLAHWLAGPESLVPLDSQAAAVAGAALVALGPSPSEADRITALASGLQSSPEDPQVQDLSWSVEVPLQEAWDNQAAADQAQAWASALALVPTPGRMEQLAGVALDAAAPSAGVPDPSGDLVLDWQVSGLPVLHRGLSQSVTANQFRSLALALILVAVLLGVAFRDWRSGLMVAAPTGVTLLVIYGAMGALGVHLDIGTSMLASLIIGAGVDYGVHLQSSWVAGKFEPLHHAAGRAAARTSKAIWTNALMVAAGFAVLTLGDARPLRNVGALTAAAMLVAAAMTFLAIPVLANRKRYLDRAPEHDPSDPLLDPGTTANFSVSGTSP